MNTFILFFLTKGSLASVLFCSEGPTHIPTYEEIYLARTLADPHALADVESIISALVIMYPLLVITLY